MHQNLNRIMEKTTVASKKKVEVSDYTTNSSAPIETPSSYTIMEGIPVPPKKRGGPSESYPFSKLEVGQSFFVVGGDDKLTSSIQSAQRRFSVVNADEPTRVTRTGNTVPNTTVTRQFQLFVVAAGYVYPNGYQEQDGGARIFRTS